MTTVLCPTCKDKVAWKKESPDRPFCSFRCKQIDLGEWASEGFSIPGKYLKEDLNEAEEEGY